MRSLRGLTNALSARSFGANARSLRDFADTSLAPYRHLPPLRNQRRPPSNRRAAGPLAQAFPPSRIRLSEEANGPPGTDGGGTEGGGFYWALPATASPVPWAHRMRLYWVARAPFQTRMPSVGREANSRLPHNGLSIIATKRPGPPPPTHPPTPTAPPPMGVSELFSPILQRVGERAKVRNPCRPMCFGQQKSNSATKGGFPNPFQFGAMSGR